MGASGRSLPFSEARSRGAESAWRMEDSEMARFRFQDLEIWQDNECVL